MRHPLAQKLARFARAARGLAITAEERAAAEHFARAIEKADEELAMKPAPRAVNFARTRTPNRRRGE